MPRGLDRIGGAAVCKVPRGETASLGYPSDWHRPINEHRPLGVRPSACSERRSKNRPENTFVPAEWPLGVRPSACSEMDGRVGHACKTCLFLAPSIFSVRGPCGSRPPIRTVHRHGTAWHDSAWRGIVLRHGPQDARDHKCVGP